MNDVRYEHSIDADEATRNEILALLKLHNYSHNEAFFIARELEEHAPRPFTVFVRDAAGAVAGGIIGNSQFKWLKVDFLVVREDLRHQGIGRKLMEFAEREAAARGCAYIFLDTMSYQAPDFYKHIGYEQAGFMRDWDSHGHDKYLFVKKIS